jgi:uncharacterized SAM-binding protein YcdF (DUF218 family)
MAIAIAKWIGGPGSLTFLAAGSLCGLFLGFVWPRHRALGRAWLVALFSGYLFLGFPLVARAIVAGLPETDLPFVAPGTHIDTLFVLDGDNPRGRVRQAAKVYGETSPRLVVVSGEDWFVKLLPKAGIPVARIQQDRRSSTTREQVDFVARFLAHSPGRAAVIASRLQMPRVAALTRNRHTDVMLIPSEADSEPAATGFWSMIPAYSALRVSRDALYERAALAYYRERNWVDLHP